MNEAERISRKGRKPGPGVDRLVNSARLGALSRNLGIEIKRHREPDQVDNGDPSTRPKRKPSNEDKDEIVKLGTF